MRLKYATAVVSAPAVAKLDCSLSMSASPGRASLVSSHTSTSRSLSAGLPSAPCAQNHLSLLPQQYSTNPQNTQDIQVYKTMTRLCPLFCYGCFLCAKDPVIIKFTLQAVQDSKRHECVGLELLVCVVQLGTEPALHVGDDRVTQSRPDTRAYFSATMLVNLYSHKKTSLRAPTCCQAAEPATSNELDRFDHWKNARHGYADNLGSHTCCQAL